jgi:hypothetical protein
MIRSTGLLSITSLLKASEVETMRQGVSVTTSAR